MIVGPRGDGEARREEREGQEGRETSESSVNEGLASRPSAHTSRPPRRRRRHPPRQALLEAQELLYPVARQPPRLPRSPRKVGLRWSRQQERRQPHHRPEGKDKEERGRGGGQALQGRGAYQEGAVVGSIQHGIHHFLHSSRAHGSRRLYMLHVCWLLTTDDEWLCTM